MDHAKCRGTQGFWYRVCRREAHQPPLLCALSRRREGAGGRCVATNRWRAGCSGSRRLAFGGVTLDPSALPSAAEDSAGAEDDAAVDPAPSPLAATPRLRWCRCGSKRLAWQRRIRPQRRGEESTGGRRAPSVRGQRSGRCVWSLAVCCGTHEEHSSTPNCKILTCDGLGASHLRCQNMQHIG
ncbi:hypothetical protein BS78_04G310300 [Paspalum vaginatum]|nr:hypothetical protein BS78_04G310300 [Paspalum vaginatum]